MAVLSVKTPSRVGAGEPAFPTTERRNSLPSSTVAPVRPPGFSYVATQTSPKVFFVPAGAPELAAPANSRPSASHARTGSPALAVRTCARAAYGEVSPG